MKHLKTILLIAIVALGIGTWDSYATPAEAGDSAITSAGADAPAISTSAPVKVTVAPLSKKSAGEITVLGTVKAKDQVKVVPSTNGQITKINVREGDHVNAGDILFELNGANGSTHPLLLQLQIAEMNFENAQRGLDAVRNGNEIGTRIARLQLENAYAQSRATPRQDTLTASATEQSQQQSMQSNDTLYSQTRLAEESYAATLLKNDAAVLQAQSQLDVARISFAMAKNQYESLAVRAPIGGVVGGVTAQAGDTVGPQTTLTKITSQRGFELEVAVTTDDAAHLSGATARVEIHGKEVAVSLKNISREADPVTRLVPLTLSLPAANLRENETLSARLTLNALASEVPESVFFVPLDALIIGTEERYIFVFDNGFGRKINVTTGVIEGDRVQVLTGLYGDELVIITGGKEITDGQAVTLE